MSLQRDRGEEPGAGGEEGEKVNGRGKEGDGEKTTRDEVRERKEG